MVWWADVDKLGYLSVWFVYVRWQWGSNESTGYEVWQVWIDRVLTEQVSSEWSGDRTANSACGFCTFLSRAVVPFLCF